MNEKLNIKLNKYVEMLQLWPRRWRWRRWTSPAPKLKWPIWQRWATSMTCPAATMPTSTGSLRPANSDSSSRSCPTTCSSSTVSSKSCITWPGPTPSATCSAASKFSVSTARFYQQKSKLSNISIIIIYFISILKGLFKIIQKFLANIQFKIKSWKISKWLKMN